MTRVVCREHGLLLAKVVMEGGRRIYRATRPIIPGGLFLADPERRRFGRSVTLGAKRQKRLPEAMETVEADLSSPEAERYTHSPEHWGYLPAWCTRCQEEYWIDVEELRKEGPKLHVPS